MDQPPPVGLPTGRTQVGPRRSTRPRGFDYAFNAASVVTLCTYHRRPLFGINGQLHPSWLGRIVERERQRTAQSGSISSTIHSNRSWVDSARRGDLRSPGSR